MKSAIITMHSLDNYGQRLQNFASEWILNQYQLNPCTVRIVMPKPIKNKIYSAKKFLLKYVMKSYKVKYKKEMLFKCFNSKYLNMSSLSYARIKRLNRFDYVFTGSDQVWNPLLDQKEIDVFFLRDVEYQKRRCMSPSFGFDVIPEEKQEIFKKYINGFQNIVVRESSGQKIIENLCHRDCERLIDPTMVVDCSVWRSIRNEKYPLPENDYLFYFFLGRNDNILSSAKKFCEEKGYYFLNIAELNSNIDSVVGPLEWLQIVTNAKMIVTDSFHGVAFSILLHKNFWAYCRNYENEVISETRIAQLLTLFGMENRYNGVIEEIEVDYSNVDSIIQHERQKWDEYLRKI